MDLQSLQKFILDHTDMRPDVFKRKFPSVVKEIYDFTASHLTPVNKLREHYDWVLNNRTDFPSCKRCGKSLQWDVYVDEYKTFCSTKCMSNDSCVQQQKKRTCNVRYGGVAPACNKQVLEQMKLTSIKRYGDNYTKVFSDRSKDVIQKRYGVSNISQKHIPDQTLTNLQDGVYLYQEHIEKQQPLQTIAASLGVTDTTINRYMRTHGIEVKRFYHSGGETEIQTFLTELGVEFITNSKNIIPPHELDIYIPSKKIAIEYNGLFWHSERNGKNALFHLNKTKLCEAAGVRLIHIFEDEWSNMREQCQDTIRHMLGKSERGVYARNTTIREIDWTEAKAFLNKYHLLGAGTAGNYRIGAFDGANTLIAVMVFGMQNNEKSDKHQIELKRFVTNKKNNPGVGSKMFAYAIKHQKYESVVAFVDRRWFTGLVKDHIGFERVSETPPSIWWTNGRVRLHRRFVTKQQLIRDGGTGQDSKRSILSTKGFYRIWDSGKLKLVWNNPHISQ